MDQIAPTDPPFRRPADYYAAPINVTPMFPRWVPLGCGGASILIIIVLAAAAAGVSSGAFADLFDIVFAQMQGEVDKMMAPDVKPPQKAAFDAEMKAMREGLRTHKLTMDRVQPLMKVLRDVSLDERVTAAEVEKLTRELHAINTK